MVSEVKLFDVDHEMIQLENLLKQRLNKLELIETIRKLSIDLKRLHY